MQIREVRKKMHCTQKQFADLIGVSERTVAAYEEGWRQPKLRTIQRIASLGQVPFMSLIKGGDINASTDNVCCQ